MMRSIKLACLAAILAASPWGIAHGQATKKSGAVAKAGADASAAARRIPGGDGLFLYLEFQGLDAHRKAWQGTATYDLLNDTKLGSLIESIVGQLAKAARAEAGPDATNVPSDVEIKRLAGRILDSGFATALTGSKGEEPTGIVVLRGMARSDVKPLVGKLLASSAAPGAEPVQAGGRSLRRLGPTTYYWSEGEDLIVVLMPVNPDAEIGAIVEAVASGTSSAADNPIRNELAKPEGSFQPALIGFVDVGIILESAPESNRAQIKSLGIDGLERVDIRWGFDAKALVTIARVKAPAPRRGLLAMLDGSTIKKDDLPPIPAGVTGFTAMALDPGAIYDKFKALMGQSDPNSLAAFENLEGQLGQQLQVNIRRDLLGRIGPEMAFYQAGGAGAAPGGMMNPFGGMTLVAEARETDALAQSIGKLVAAFGPALANGKGPGASPRPTLRALPDGRTFELELPPGATPVPIPILPTLAVGGDRIALALSPVDAQKASTPPQGRWTPQGEFAKVFEKVPAEMVLLNLNDPRETLPGLIEALPQLAFGLNMGINQARAASAQAQGRPAPTDPLLQINPGMVPRAQEIASRMFPATTVLESTPEGLTMTTRESFPGLTSPATGGVAIALLLPAVQAAREAARRAQCSNNLKQIALAMYNYESANGTFPPAAILGPDGKPLLSWRVAILPYLELNPLYQQFHLDEPWDSPNNKPLMDEMPSVFVCPSTPGTPGHACYGILTGAGMAFEGKTGHKVSDFTDGTSNTLMVVETNDSGPWTQPGGIDAIEPAALLEAMGSMHPGGFNAAFADGSVHFLKRTIAPAVLKALSTRGGGEVIGAGDY